MSDPQTFLFVDLVGYTALADSEGDDRAADVALELQRRVSELLGSHGAEAVKALGDGVMLRCTEPGAAVRLGLKIVSEFEADPAVPSVRVGVHTGTAVGRQGDWYGRAVNVAARLCSVAAGGEVLVSEATRAAAGKMSRVDFAERQRHWLRNVTEPVVTYSAHERPRTIETVRGVLARIKPDRTCALARLEPV